MKAGTEGPHREQDPARTPEAILERLLREASETIPGLSPDPKQADPVVVMLLKAFAREYAEVYRDLDDTVGLAYRALVERLIQFPRGPSPATTVLEIESKDPSFAVSAGFEILCERPVADREGRNHQVHFTPIAETKLSPFEVSHFCFIDAAGEGRCWPAREGKASRGLGGAGKSFRAPPPANPALLIAIDSGGGAAGDPCVLFLHGPEPAVRSCLWGRWSLAGEGLPLIALGNDLGGFLIPALRDDRRVPEPDLFSFRSSVKGIASPYAPCFVPLDAGLLLEKAVPAPAAGGSQLAGLLAPARGRRAWVRIDMEPQAAVSQLDGLKISTRSVLAANRETRTSGALDLDNSPVQLIPFPEGVTHENLLSIDDVIDLRTGHRYELDSPDREPGPRSYRLTHAADARDARLALEVRTSAPPEPGARIEARYSLCLGSVANGLAPGSVRVILSPKDFPGVVSASNLVPTIGGGPAPSLTDADLAFRCVLRTRGRAVSRADLEDLAYSFDPARIAAVRVGRGVMLGKRGPRICADVAVAPRPGAFFSDLEREVFRDRLARHLDARAPLGMAVRVEVSSE